MMTYYEELAGEAVGLPGWTWMEGMLWRRLDVPHLSWRVLEGSAPLPPGALPDFRDAATLGLVEHRLLAPRGVILCRTLVTEDRIVRYTAAQWQGSQWSWLGEASVLLPVAMMVALRTLPAAPPVALVASA